MTKGVAASLVVLLALGAFAAWVVAAAPPVQPSPPGQISVVTVNARQHRTLGINRFTAMFELSKALRFRPTAFDGGQNKATMPPDVIVVTEITPSNAEIFERQMRQRFDQSDYRLVGATNVKAFVIVNQEEVIATSEGRVWEDGCANERLLGDQPGVRRYQHIRLREQDSGTEVTLAAIHLAKNYEFTGQRDCHLRNVQELRAQLERESPVVIAGDFNKRSVGVARECDLEESSTPLQWWAELVTPSSGHAYIDAIKSSHSGPRATMADEWTHEQKSEKPLCTGFSQRQRSRIDYIFVSDAIVADAHTDHPGWAGPQPGTRNRGVYKYSDHRFVWARIILSGPPRPNPPTADAGAGGLVRLSWSPVDGASGYVVLRAIGHRPYSNLANVPGEALTFDDTTTRHGNRYRYAIAARGTNGGQGLESRGTFAFVDARGPRIVGTRPHRDATGVARRVTILVYFDEAVASESVTSDTIALFNASGRRLPGFVSQVRGDVLALDPDERLGKRKRYVVQVQGVADSIGNFGPGYSWVFTTGRR